METVPIDLAEQTEIAGYVDFVLSAPPALRERLGIASARFGPAPAAVIGEDPTCFFNRTGGFTFDEPPTTAIAEQARDFYRAQGVAAGSLAAAPALLPDGWAESVAKLGFSPGARFAKLGATVEQVVSAGADAPALHAGLRLAQVNTDDAPEWGAVMMETFGFTAPGMTDLGASYVGRESWRHYGVWEDDRIVAVGSVFFNGDCADMFGGATLERARGRGAQTALLRARAESAQEAGCRWLVAETAVEQGGEHNTSLHNLNRLGFELLYERTNWVWRAQ